MSRFKVGEIVKYKDTYCKVLSIGYKNNRVEGYHLSILLLGDINGTLGFFHQNKLKKVPRLKQLELALQLTAMMNFTINEIAKISFPHTNDGIYFKILKIMDNVCSSWSLSDEAHYYGKLYNTDGEYICNVDYFDSQLIKLTRKEQFLIAL